MKYNNILKAVFINRPNRFMAQVSVDGREVTVHVKNTGRCKELLVPGAVVILEESTNPLRKTKYDLIAVYKDGLGLVNIDSIAPNKAVYEWLQTKNYDVVKPEYTYGGSRFDFYMEKGSDRYLIEVKGCTFEINGIGYFPDAPTERGIKHLKELAEASRIGYKCTIAFVIQMPNINIVKANTAAHAEFGAALEEAKAAGVNVLMLQCRITEDSLEIIN